MQLLSFAMVYAYVKNPHCGVLAVFYLLRLTLQYGITGPSLYGFVAYGYVLFVNLGRKNEGVRFGQVALRLLEQTGSQAFLPRVSFISHGLLNRYTVPLRMNIEPLLLANRLALKTGDKEGCSLNAYYHVETSFHAGKHLNAVEQDARSHCQTLDTLKVIFGLQFVVPFWSAICELHSSPPGPLEMSGIVTDVDSAMKTAEASDNRKAFFLHYEYRTIVSCLTGDYNDAVMAADKARESLPEIDMWLSFYDGLSSLAIARSKTGMTRWQLLLRGQKAASFAKQCAVRCPSNFENKQALLEAEVASVKGRPTKALALYSKSIKTAQREGFVHEEGLAFERLAWFHCFLDNELAAVSYFERARDAYHRWGAGKLVTRLEQQISLLKRS